MRAIANALFPLWICPIGRCLFKNLLPKMRLFHWMVVKKYLERVQFVSFFPFPLWKPERL